MMNEPSNAYDILNDSEDSYRQQQEPFDAGFWKRFLAMLIDTFILAATVGILVFLLVFFRSLVGVSGSAATADSTIQDTAAAISGVIILAAYFFCPWLYFSLFERSKFQATPGKMALGIVVVNQWNHRTGFGQATGRYWAKLLSDLFYIGYMIAGWTQRKQALHDLIAGTYVVNKSELQKVKMKQQEYEQYKREQNMDQISRGMSG